MNHINRLILNPSELKNRLAPRKPKFVSDNVCKACSGALPMTTMVQAVANTYRCPVCNHLTCQVNIISRWTDTQYGNG